MTTTPTAQSFDIEATPVALLDTAAAMQDGTAQAPRLSGKRIGMVLFSSFPYDPRPRRAVEALLEEGAAIDLICLADEREPLHESRDGLNVRRIPITQERGGKFSYAYRYSSFIVASSALLAARCLRRRYDLIYVHNMPDVLVVSALIPKLFGAKVILDQHDPMPELATTIFNLAPESRGVRIIARLEKWSLGQADLVLTVNEACRRMFGMRSCSAAKIGVVMNSPDEKIFPLRAVERPSAAVRPSQPFVIMYHGSIVERNGLDLAVTALERVRQTIPDAQLKIYGRETPFLTRVMDDARSKGLAERVLYMGGKKLEDLVPAIESCHVGVIPNHRNAFTDINTPTRIFEYLALGKPVIAPATQGILDYFTKDSLLLFEPGNADDIARRLEFAANHYQEAQSIAARGQQTYLQHSWKQERATLIQLVSTLCQGAEA